MRVIAIEEHFITPMYREKVGASEARKFYLKSRSDKLGHEAVGVRPGVGALNLHADSRTIDGHAGELHEVGGHAAARQGAPQRPRRLILAEEHRHDRRGLAQAGEAMARQLGAKIGAVLDQLPAPGGAFGGSHDRKRRAHDSNLNG